MEVTLTSIFYVLQWMALDMIITGMMEEQGGFTLFISCHLNWTKCHELILESEIAHIHCNILRASQEMKFIKKKL